MSGLRVGSLFSGVGGLDLAVEAFFNAETVWHCEVDPEPSKVLAAHWPTVPNLGDITAVDWSTVEPVDIVCGGFPCQDLSLAGRRAGMRPGTRSGLWADFVKAIDALKPSVVIIENVRGVISGCAESDSDMELCPGCVAEVRGVSHAPRLRALGRVLGDLHSLGFDAEWHGLRASDIGAPHRRFRVFVVAYARGVRLGERWGAASRQAAGRRAPTVARGHFGASVDLLPTPCTTDNGSNSPGDNARRSPGLRTIPSMLLPTPTTAPDTGNGHARNLGKEIALLPTPDASNANDGEQLDTWLERRERVKATGINGNGMGMPLAIAVLTLLPTPVTTDAKGARNSTAHRKSRGGHVTGPVAWGKYAPAVTRWEALTRPAPSPTRPDGKGGRDRLSPLLSEWMMGYSAGWVTDILARGPAIKACGNGVVPQQAYAALGVIWARIISVIGVDA